MPSLNLLTVTLSILSSVKALPQAPNGYGNSAKKALYFLQNNPSGSSLISLDVSNGKAGNPVRTATEGVGLVATNMTSNQPVNIDSLQSQGAVAVDGNYAFTLNSGSHTLAMFKIDPLDPTHPVLAGKPVDTLGEFPVSVAFDNSCGRVCVVNGGAKNNLACWTLDNGQLRQDGEVRPLGLNTTTPPLNAPNTASQVSFSPDSQKVVVSVKGAAPPMTPGSLFVYPVESGGVSQTPVKSSIANIPDDFGFVFGEDSSRLLLSDPTFGGSIIELNPQTHVATEVKHTQSSLNASCWAAYSPATGLGYTFDAARPQIASFDFRSGDLMETIPTDPAFMSAFDAVIDGTSAYFIAGAPSIGIFDVQQKKTIQNLNLQGLPGIDDRRYWSGMAMWSSN